MSTRRIDMKRYNVLVVMLILVMMFMGCNDAVNDAGENPSVNEPENNQVITDNPPIEDRVSEVKTFTDESLNYYEIVAALDVDKNIITARQTITYTNNEGMDLKEVYLHLYPNAFQKGNHPSLFDTDLNEIEQQYGQIEIITLKVDDETVSHDLKPIETTLYIPFNFVKDKTYTITMEYTVSISTTSERFGIADGIYNLGNWYPVLAVFDEDGWNLDPYYSIGDPFYSDVSNYDVKISVPSDYEVAASGYLYDLIEDGEMTQHAFRADRMRDFAFVIGQHLKVISEKINDTTVYLYYPEAFEGHKWLDDSLTYGSTAIGLFSEKIGMYPYENYSVVLTNFPSGMEYPGIVFISTHYLEQFGINSLRNVIVHETVHQWFYSIIGDDEIDEGWIDEGLTSYFTAYYDMKEFREGYYYDTMTLYEKRINSVGVDNVIMLKSAKDYSDWTEYGAAAYAKPAVMYHKLFEEYGEDKILEFAQLLYTDYQFGILKEEGIREAIVTVYGGEITKFLDTWLK